jgi:hypothetical protein
MAMKSSLGTGTLVWLASLSSPRDDGPVGLQAHAVSRACGDGDEIGVGRGDVGIDRPSCSPHATMDPSALQAQAVSRRARGDGHEIRRWARGRCIDLNQTNVIPQPHATMDPSAFRPRL